MEKKRLFEGRHFENVLAARSCLCDVNPFDSKWAATDSASFTRSVGKIYFFQAITHFTIFNAIISEFGECLAQNNTTREQPKPRLVV